ncbi:hypothetical protein BU25DRAFT_418927 [Macroventuria anomochaeta]|uniref:Uncharacterized protein n=1 Tax=Macroventuria anomochaeta TaxID=301207 RepID=A0ACB6SDE7_9PLEO|nr:uncharacterized protein BU25DRAFT_418927 [Macroventuria anomochaeta]KAF2631334.1 hypothetical protein BU25DRAFT_418927 [Macroventuria anomochaeta]
MGFNIQRCGYRDDDAWKALITAWKEEVASGIRGLYVDSDRIADALDMKCKRFTQTGLGIIYKGKEKRDPMSTIPNTACMWMPKHSTAVYNSWHCLKRGNTNSGCPYATRETRLWGKSPYVNIVRPPTLKVLNSIYLDDKTDAEVPVSIEVFPWTVLQDVYEAIGEDWFYQAVMEDWTHDQDRVVV